MTRPRFVFGSKQRGVLIRNPPFVRRSLYFNRLYRISGFDSANLMARTAFHR